MGAIQRSFSKPVTRLVEPSPIGEAVSEFLGFLAQRGASLNTIAAYRTDLDQLANSMEVSRADSGDAALDRATIEQFVVGLRGRGYRDASIARKLAAARSFFVFLGAEGSVSANPTEGFALPRVAKALPGLISAREVRKLLDQPGGIPRRRRSEIVRCASSSLCDGAAGERTCGVRHHEYQPRR